MQPFASQTNPDPNAIPNSTPGRDLGCGLDWILATTK